MHKMEIKDLLCLTQKDENTILSDCSIVRYKPLRLEYET